MIVDTTNTVTAVQAARLLGLNHASNTHIALRQAGVPSHRNGRLWTYDRSAVEALAVTFNDRATFAGWLDSASVARRFNVPYATIHRWATSGVLPCRLDRSHRRWYDPAIVAAFVPPSAMHRGRARGTRNRPREPVDSIRLYSADDGWYTMKQIAQRFSVTYTTVVRWVRSGAFHVSARTYDFHGRPRFDPALVEAFVPPQTRHRSRIADAGRLGEEEAAAFLECSRALVSSAARDGTLLFVRIDDVRAFDRRDLEAWWAAKNAPPPAGPLISFADASRLMGYAHMSSVRLLVKAGRLAVVLDDEGRPRLNRTEVEAMAATRKAKQTKRG